MAWEEGIHYGSLHGQKQWWKTGAWQLTGPFPQTNCCYGNRV